MSRPALLLALLLPVSVAAAPSPSDPVESLIETQKRREAEWAPPSRPVGQTVLRGDMAGVELQADTVIPANDALCDGVEFGELAGAGSAFEMPLNTAVPRIRALLERNCIVRPGEMFVAVGPGEQKAVSVRDFAVRRTKAYCKGQGTSSLWGRFGSSLPWRPLFFTSDPKVGEGKNAHRFAAQVTTEPCPAALLRRLETKMPFIEDYRVTLWRLDAPNCDAVVEFRRRQVGTADEGLAHVAFFAVRGDLVEPLLSEPVRLTAATGDWRLASVLDYNGDGRPELWFEGGRGECPFSALFEGADLGFMEIPVPRADCDCGGAEAGPIFP